ncbi:MAG: hotdog fold thioesterase [Candidatus Phosphoribacter sp.]|nr:hotdog fold thioesterase [Actinomycetales bacterium]
MTDTGVWLTSHMVNEIAQGTLSDRMGIEFLEISTERAVARMPVEGNTQPYGLLHGGASVVLAESLGSFLAVNLAGPGRAAVGVDINATHHRPATSGWVTGVATPLAVGRTTASFDIVITDEEGRRTCTCRFTAQLRDAPPRASGARLS